MPESDRPQYTWVSRFIRCIHVIFLLMFIVQGIVGCVYFNDCPVATYIPALMVVSGFIPVFWVLSWCNNGCGTLSSSLVSGLYCIWLFIGAVLVYCNYYNYYYHSSNSRESDHYCNKTLYLFAFWSSNMTYIVSAVYIACCFCNVVDPFPFRSSNDEARPLLWT